MSNQIILNDILLDDGLFRQFESFKSANRYSTDSQAIVELIRTGLEYFAEQAEDEYLLALAEERKRNDNGVRYSHEDIMRIYGITEEDLKNAEDIEIE